MAKQGKTASMVTKLRRLGLHVERSGDQWFARVNGYKLSITDQGGEIIAIYVQRLSAQADPITDFYPGSYFPSLASAMRFIARSHAEAES